MSKKGPSIQEMRTPLWLFEALQRYIGVRFTLDAAASKENALCKRYFTEADNALSLVWDAPAAFCNPPFRRFYDWIEHGMKQAERGNAKTVCLVGPVGCSQSWFHEVAIQGTILAPDRRISFLLPDGTPTHQADRDTMIYLFGERWRNVDSESNFRVWPFPLPGIK